LVGRSKKKWVAPGGGTERGEAKAAAPTFSLHVLERAQTRAPKKQRGNYCSCCSLLELYCFWFLVLLLGAHERDLFFP